ncbi:hypothetical protein N7G274_009221 [Stereocaulon virgatum]|uniref:Uncharacterized protein n=1 Tax=Stereocaulon virgatum TaxID=373712 RepID=A0ABR3ZZ73_9LECA
MFFPFFFTMLWATLISAETICEPTLPGQMPTLASCDIALRKLEDYLIRCPEGRILVGPIASEHGIRLPLYFTGFSPVPPIPHYRCVLRVIWQRRQERQPVASFDFLKASDIQQAAFRIRDQCVKGSESRNSQLGREWILPREWVLVSLGSARLTAGLDGNATNADNRMTSVVWGDGTNESLNSSTFEQVGTCSDASELRQNGTAPHIVNDSPLDTPQTA